MHIDQLLIHLDPHVNALSLSMPSSDISVIKGMRFQLKCGIFLRERQGALLVQVLTRHCSVIEQVLGMSVSSALDMPTWSKTLRKSTRVRKIYLSDEYPNQFLVHFSQNPRLLDKLFEVNSQLLEYPNSVVAVQNTTTTTFAYSLIEPAVDAVISAFANESFEIDSVLLDYYSQISEIKKTTSPFDISTSVDSTLAALVKTAVGTDPLRVVDNSIAYQYSANLHVCDQLLTSKLAHRTDRRVFVNSETISLSELFKSLVQLDRLPALCVFPDMTATDNLRTLLHLKGAVESTFTGPKIGVYFRYDNYEQGTLFNTAVAEHKLNQRLDNQTTVACILNNSLPKFIIRHQWKPRTVISFTERFIRNRSATYCNDCDLVVYYVSTLPVEKDTYDIM